MRDGKKNIKKKETRKSYVTYGSHHRPELPSVSAVMACWHPLVTAQDGNNPGQRNCDKRSLNLLRTRFQRWGRGRRDGLQAEGVIVRCKSSLAFAENRCPSAQWGSAGFSRAEFLTFLLATNPRLKLQCSHLLVSHKPVINCKYKRHIPSPWNLNSL